MAPGPKKRSFHTPRNTKNAPVSKNNEKKSVESSNEVNKTIDINSNLSTDSVTNQKSKYSKRTVESNWDKYEEPVNDPHADSTRGEAFDVLLSYSGGSGSQLKLQDEREWEDEYMKDISLHIPDLVNAVKCIPFHERIGLQSIFDEKVIKNFIESSEKFSMSYKSQSKSPVLEHKDLTDTTTDPALNIIEEPDMTESDDYVSIKTFPVQDKTEDIINSLASNLSFKNFPEKEATLEELSVTEHVEDKKSETASNDLDFLLSLNISSKVSVKEENSASKSDNVDDWLNSILDD